MVSVAEGFNESYPAVASSVSRARRAITAFAMAAGVRGEQLDAVRLAVSAAVTNVVKHAYPDGPGRVEVSAAIASSELWVLIADEGCGLRADRPSRGCGLGLALIALLSDGFTIARRSSAGIELRMQFTLPAAQSAIEERAHDVRVAAPLPAPATW
jgi:anti-sigma regulatory factor (Ser/Thr protein kinase)